MKTYFLIALMAIGSLTLNAQEKESTIQECSFEVNGVCNMCKERIENSALRAKGVKTAEWNKETKKITVVYNSKKTDETAIKQSVASSGHDVDSVKSTNESYAKLPPCCAYRDKNMHTH